MSVLPVWTPEHNMRTVRKEATRVSGALGLELQRIVCHHKVLGTEPISSARAVGALNLLAIFPAPCHTWLLTAKVT